MATYKSQYTGAQIDQRLGNAGQDLNTSASPSFVAQTLSGLQVFADDTAAGVGGLTAGQVYQTATGELRIKL